MISWNIDFSPIANGDSLQTRLCLHWNKNKKAVSIKLLSVFFYSFICIFFSSILKTIWCLSCWRACMVCLDRELTVKGLLKKLLYFNLICSLSKLTCQRILWRFCNTDQHKVVLGWRKIKHGLIMIINFFVEIVTK